MTLAVVLVLSSACAGWILDRALLPSLLQPRWASAAAAAACAGAALALVAALRGVPRRRLYFLAGAVVAGKLLSLLAVWVAGGFTTLPPWAFPAIDAFCLAGAVAFAFRLEREVPAFAGFAAADSRQRRGDGRFKILDTSVIIDGRIADIVETGFVEGTLVVPQFVLAELQQIADSSDAIKRSRGRRGLDILNKMKLSEKCAIKISDQDFPDVAEVDTKLLELAKVLDAVVVTNDYNLNKVAAVRGIPVLNVNEVANALKPSVLPGEEMTVQVIKEGKDPNQGIAYLDDGTMIVIDQGRPFIHQKVDVVVTSVFQTPAGRMIFTQPARA